MPGEDYQSWSTTAASNGTADTLIDWHEGQTRASVNNSSRSEMAAHAKNRNLLNGSIVTFGTANAQQFLSGVSYTTVPTGLVVKLKIGAGLTSTGAATLNMDSIGDVGIITTNGDVLLGRELVAESYTDLLYNGTNWVFLYSQQFIEDQLHGGGGIILSEQIFSTAGTFVYTPTPTMEACIIECVGGGGAGGGASSAPAIVLGGGGGGSGGYSRSYKTAAEIGASQPLTVGAAGLGDDNTSGGDGGDTFVGESYATAICAARGGGGGSVAHETTDYITSGDGGDVGIGDVAAAGSPGGPGEYGGGALYVTSNATGGSSHFGGGGLGSRIAATGDPQGGNPARNYGSGGSGGNTFGDSSVGGGNGSAGVIIITEFAGRGAPGRDGTTGPMGPAGPSGSGTGDVLRTGIPTAGQIAVWADASHIQGIFSDIATTGDVKLTFKTVADSGWIILNDGSIGDATSGGTTRANADTSALFALFWTNVSALVVQDSTGATVTRGANAAADYAAHRRIVLPKTLGRALAGAGTGAGLSAHPLGSTTGAETETITIAKMPAHNHSFASGTVGSVLASTGIGSVSPSGGNFSPVTMDNRGGGTPASIMQPTTFLNVMCKL